MVGWCGTDLYREAVERLWALLGTAGGSPDRLLEALSAIGDEHLGSIVDTVEELTQELAAYLREEIHVESSDSTLEEYALSVIEAGREKYVEALQDDGRGLEAFLDSDSAMDLPLLDTLLDYVESRLQ